jgi:hypothetical protein
MDGDTDFGGAFAKSAEKRGPMTLKSDPFVYDSLPRYHPPPRFRDMTRQQDPVVNSSFREAIVVVSIWLIAMTWTITVCYRMGYGRPVEEVKKNLVYGFPDWIFWGIVVPWCVCTVVSCFFSALLFRDGHLGEDVENADDLGLGG